MRSSATIDIISILIIYIMFGVFSDNCRSFRFSCNVFYSQIAAIIIQLHAKLLLYLKRKDANKLSKAVTSCIMCLKLIIYFLNGSSQKK